MSDALPRWVWVDGELRTGRRAPTSRCSTAGSSWATGCSRRSARAAGGSPSSRSTPRGCGDPRTGWRSRCRATSSGCWLAGSATLLAAEGLDGPDGDASIRVTVSRGPWASRGLLPPASVRLTATVVIQAWPVVPPPADHLERGLSLVASRGPPRPRQPDLALKTTSRADYVFARLEARRAGAEDAVFLTLNGHLSEATTANIFLVRRRPTA